MDKRETDVRRGRIKDDKELVQESGKETAHFQTRTEAPSKPHKQTTNPKVCSVFLIRINGSTKSQVLPGQLICPFRSSCYQKHSENYITPLELQSFNAKGSPREHFCNFTTYWGTALLWEMSFLKLLLYLDFACKSAAWDRSWTRFDERKRIAEVLT